MQRQSYGVASAADAFVALAAFAPFSDSGAEENVPVPGEEAALRLEASGKYLIFPVSNNGERSRMKICDGDRLVHNVDCDFPAGKDSVDWWSYLDMEDCAGRTVSITVEACPEIREMIRFSDEVPHLQPLYDETLRPQFHMSQMRGWNNDPNGMVYSDGTYHFFWQSNPGGRNWANMYWGHATSPDMVHWTEQKRALRPFGDGVENRHPSMAVGSCFSGSAHVDAEDTAGWRRGDAKTMVLAFTDTGCGESIAYSVDGGKSFIYYEGNPVIRHRGRDPKLVWYEPGRHWVIAVFNEAEEIGKNIAFYTSVDLKEWKHESTLLGYFECPELFEIAVDGEPGKTKWVVFGGDAQYAVGDFDGKRFTPDHEDKRRLHWGSFYASQCFSNPPDGRVVQIGWAGIDIPEMPFNQTFSAPLNLTLRATEEGLRLFANPIRELENLRMPNPEAAEDVALTSESPEIAFDVEGQLFDVLLVLKPGTAKKALLRFGENTVVCDFAARTIDEMPMRLTDGRAEIRVLVDRPMYEVVGCGGATFKTSARSDMGKPVETVSLTAEEGDLTVESFRVHAMRSAWEKSE